MQFKNPWVVVCVALLLSSGCATGTPTTRKIDELNKKAMADFKAGNPGKAEEELQSALALAEKDKVTDHRSLAEAHMNLGVVAASGSGQRRKAVDHMAKALAIKPDLHPDKAYRNAKVDKAFASAQKRAETAQKAKQEAAEKAKPVVVAAAPPPDAPLPAAPPPKPQEPPAPPPPVAAKKSKQKGKKAAEEKKAVEEKSAAVDVAVATKPSAVAPPAVPAGPVVEALVEAKVPSPVPEPVFCPLPDEVPPGQDLAVWCAVDSGVHAKKASLFVRPPDQTEFTKLAMERSPEGWWVATIPGASVKGTLLQFYVQAEKPNGDSLAATGNNESPSLVLIRAGARPVKKVITQSFLDGEDAPAEASKPVEVAPPSSGFQWRKMWIAFQAGSGYGWHGAANLEFRQDLKVQAGTAGAGTFHVLPELGYRLSDKWSTSLQVRIQKLPNEGNTGGRVGGPAPGALAALLRMLYEKPVSKRLTVAGSVYLGGGEGVRLVMNPIPGTGRSGTDSVRGGPLLVGAGAGVFYGLTEKFDISADLRALVGAPDLAVIGELNLGLRYAFE